MFPPAASSCCFMSVALVYLQGSVCGRSQRPGVNFASFQSVSRNAASRMSPFQFSGLDCFFTSLGLPLFLMDIILDILAAVDFYQEGSHFCLAVLLVLLVGSSVLAQLFSWFWYRYDDFVPTTKVDKVLNPHLGVLHWFQLGIYVRHAAILETAIKGCSDEASAEMTVYMNQDLSMLRIIETFSESAPQIVLMLAVILQEGRPDPIKVLKTVGSLSAVAFCVTTYHRCMRSFLAGKKKQPLSSSVVYFLWNLLLLSARIVALALFAAVEPCYIFTHFLCSWLLLFFFAFCCKTKFMECVGGEWLFRATVGLIWYFDWFNVAEGRTRNRTVLYHTYILLDICALCGLWYWRMSTDPPHFDISCLQAAIVGGAVVAGYIMGLVWKIVYYKFFHPTLYKEELVGEVGVKQQSDEVDFKLLDINQVSDDDSKGEICFRSVQKKKMETGLSQPAHCNKRMRKLAENFYSRSAADAEA